MKTVLIILLSLQCLSITSLHCQENNSPGTRDGIEGQWIRFGPAGPVSLNFNSDGTVEGDLGNDNTIEIVSAYTLEKDRIEFVDKEGVTCPEPGIYRIYINDYYVSFDLIEDNCGGRIKATMGFWVRPGHEELIARLSEHINADPSSSEAYLSRGRMYLAIGKSYEAGKDFDKYLEYDPDNARALINRAGSRFPADMKGAVEDCSRAIELDNKAKNAYFLRGLALYELGEKEKACEDFHRAIELGFTILKEAESARCSEIWKTYKDK